MFNAYTGKQFSIFHRNSKLHFDEIMTMPSLHLTNMLNTYVLYVENEKQNIPHCRNNFKIKYQNSRQRQNGYH